MAPAFLIAITIHELAHGMSAYWLGDTTAKNEGRLTLNPIKHLDPLGTIVFIASALQGMGIGWAKPVPINPYRFKNIRRDMVLVSLAGPFSNFALALLLAPLFRLGVSYDTYIGNVLAIAVWLNIWLGIFNLLPIPPLDGSKIIPALLPQSAQQTWFKFEKYGMLILIVLAISGGLFGTIILGPAKFLFYLIMPSQNMPVQ
ncbi:MAG: site-2 protease family protein [Rubrobacteridae bacterium]|nr:site-2 protease family protein [Rubrobacteridae bacterium]